MLQISETARQWEVFAVIHPSIHLEIYIPATQNRHRYAATVAPTSGLPIVVSNTASTPVMRMSRAPFSIFRQRNLLLLLLRPWGWQSLLREGRSASCAQGFFSFFIHFSIARALSSFSFMLIAWHPRFMQCTPYSIPWHNMQQQNAHGVTKAELAKLQSRQRVMWQRTGTIGPVDDRHMSCGAKGNAIQNVRPALPVHL